MPTLLTVNNPAAMLMLRPFVLEAVKGFPLAASGDDAVTELFQQIIASENSALFVVAEGTDFYGLAAVILPMTALSPVPQVLHFYAKGPRVVKKLLIDAVVDFVHDNGYNRFWAMNMTKAPTSVWKRAFRRAGEGTTLGTIVEFKTNERGA